MPTNNKNKTDKNHRNKKKNNKRMAELAAYAKKKKIPKAPPPGKLVDKNAERLKQLRKSNSIVALTAGINDTIKAYKNRNKG